MTAPTLTYGFWQSWDAPVSEAEIGRRVQVQLRSGQTLDGEIVSASRKPIARVRLDDGSLIRLHADAESYRLACSMERVAEHTQKDAA